MCLVHPFIVSVQFLPSGALTIQVTVVYVLNHGLYPQILSLQDTPYITEIMFAALQIREFITVVRILVKHNVEIEMFSCSTAHARHMRITYHRSSI